MNANLHSFGELIKTYRKSNNYSTQELADKLDISAGLINNIENAKVDSFNFNLFINIGAELNIPIHKMLTSIFINNISKTDDISTLTATMLELISFEFNLAVSEYENKEQAVNVIGNLILSQLNSIKDIKELT